MDLRASHPYEPVSGSAVEEYDLNDISEAHHILSPDDEGDLTRLLRPSIKRAYSNLAHGHNRPKIGPLQKDARRVAWQAGIRWTTIGAASVLMLNITITIIIAARFGVSNGVASLYTGDCTTVTRIDSALHVLINLLSPGFLGASNYVMQVLNAPTRKQVDEFHERGLSLHIGIPSFQNAIRLAKRQSILWALLGLSAMPLHLFWNSVVFTTLEATQYNIFLVASDFNTTDFKCSLPDSCNRAKELYDLSRTPQGLDYLDNASCLKTYSVDFLTGRRNLLLVTNATSAVHSNGEEATEDTVITMFDSISWNKRLDAVGEWDAEGWWCFYATNPWRGSNDYECSLSDAVANAAALEYQVGNLTLEVKYCLSESTPGRCSLGFIVYVMMIVILCNAIKVASMICSLWALTDDLLVVIGDALSSFLETPDANTEDCCLMEARDDLSIRSSLGRVWKAKKRRWFSAATTFSIIRCFSCALVSLAASGYLLLMALGHISGATSYSSLAFGGVSAYALLNSFTPKSLDPSGFTALVLAVMVANSPQLLFSTLYFMYNRLLTSMLAMDEWSRFVSRSSTLRVSYPSRGQRSTYWLQLPYAYGVPLMITTSVMHWFISQSIFLARVQIYDADGNLYDQASPGSTGLSAAVVDSIISTPGYSAKGIVASMSVGGVMLLFLFGLGLRRYRGGTLLIGNNSLAISAACHPPADDNDPAHSEVKWGVVAYGRGVIPGHCCLTSKPVTPPTAGNRYAG